MSETATAGADRNAGSAGGAGLAVAFCRSLRQAGMSVPPSATINYVQALGLVGLDRRSSVYWAGRSTLLARPEDIGLYDRVFAAFWQQTFGPMTVTEAPPPPITLALDTDEEPDEPERDPSEEADEEIQSVRFSRTEILTDKDFADCSADELAELTSLMARLRFTTHHRQSRRQVPTKARRGDRPDLRRTVQRSIRHQGEPVSRAFTSADTRPRRLVLVLDVSGSMEAYARALIRFAHAAAVARSRVEVFALGTRLTRLTRHLTSRDPDQALAVAVPKVADWAGGTRLGDGIAEFNEEWGIRGMARGSIVVILSDGWDRGDPAELGAAMERLHRVTHELVWVNPLKATPGYAPLAAGMAAALPHIDRFVEGHSFSSLEQLAVLLSGDRPRRRSA